MKLVSLEAILGALKRHDVRYLIAGGLAVVAYGYGRLTIDVDLVVQLESPNVLRALEALGSLEYRPVAPFCVEQFTDRTIREAWVREKNMFVFGLHSPRHPDTPIDIFATEPFDFDLEFQRALVGELAPGVETRFVNLDTLVRMKTATGCERERDDIQHLHWILEDESKKMSESEETIDWSKTTFEGSRREQLRRFRALSLREKMEAVEGMAAVVHRFEQMRREGALRSNEGRTGGRGRGGNDDVSESNTPRTLTSEGKSPTRQDGDWWRIEVMDDVMAEVLRRKSPAERIAIGFGLWRSAGKILRAQLASLHPEWDARKLEQEIVRRLSHGAV